MMSNKLENKSQEIIKGAYVAPIDLSKLEESVKKHDPDNELQLPPLVSKADNAKDAQIEALAYLLIAVCIPAIDYYRVPARHGVKTILQIRKANIARAVLKDAGF